MKWPAMPKLTTLKLSRRHLLILIGLVLVAGGGYSYLRLREDKTLIRGKNFEIENLHPDWILNLRRGGGRELTALIKKYLGEDGYLKITLTTKEMIETYVVESFPIKLRNFEVHAILGMDWEGKTQHLFLGPTGVPQSWGDHPPNFYPSFDVFHLFGKEDKDELERRLTEEEWERLVSNPLFTLTVKE